MNPNDPLIDRVREVFGGSSFSFPPSEPDGRMAAVLVPLVYHEGEWNLLFTRRSDQLVDHKGEVSFPGGSVEKQDRDFRIRHYAKPGRKSDSCQNRCRFWAGCMRFVLYRIFALNQ